LIEVVITELLVILQILEVIGNGQSADAFAVEQSVEDKIPLAP
jgi:hypothetical protein